MAEIEITIAPEARDIAAELIPEVHPHLDEAKILYLFTTQEKKRCDRVRLGSAVKASALIRFLSSGNVSVADGYDFIVQFDINQWHILTDAQRRALTDHELEHCGGGPGEWRLRGHDVEEFESIIRRHGFWKSDLKSMGRVIQQMPLLPDEE